MFKSYLELPPQEKTAFDKKLNGIHSRYNPRQESSKRDEEIMNLFGQFSVSLPEVLEKRYKEATLNNNPTRTPSTTKNYHSAVFGEHLSSEIIAGENIYRELDKNFSLGGGIPRILFIKNINDGFSFKHDERKYRYSGNTLPYNGTLMMITGMSSRIDGPAWDGYNTSCVSILPEDTTADDIYGAFKEIKEIVQKSNPGKAKLTIGTPLRDGRVLNQPFLDFFNEDGRKYPIVSLDELKKNNVYGEQGNEKGIFPILSNMNMPEETEYLFNDPKITTINWDFIDGSKEIYSDADVTFVFPRRKLPEEKKVTAKQKSIFEKIFGI